jgi:hypothetical protein
MFLICRNARMVLACRRGTGAVHGHIRSILDSGCELSGMLQDVGIGPARVFE